MTENENTISPDTAQVEDEVRARPEFTRFVAIDIETTGLNPAEGEIIELGAVRFIDQDEVETYHSLVKPDHGLPERNRRLTGIEPSMLESARDSKSALEDFVEFIGDDLLISHNAPFDRKFIQHHLGEQGHDPIENPMLCTLHLSAIVNPEAVSLQLGNLARMWKIEIIDPHRALQDARMAGRLFIKLMNDIRMWRTEFIAHLADYRGKSLDPIFDLFDELVGDPPGDMGKFNLGREIVRRLRNHRKECPLPLLKLPEVEMRQKLTADEPLENEIRDAFKRGGITFLEDTRPGAGPASCTIPIGPKGIPNLVVAIPDESYIPEIVGPDNGMDGCADESGAFFLGTRSDYVCTYRAFDLDGRPLGWLELSPFERVVLARWLAGTHTGRIARVNWWLLNNFSGLKGHLNTLSISSLECIGPSASKIENCFVELARLKAEKAGRIIVTQKHLCTRKKDEEIQERLLESVDACIIENASKFVSSARETESYTLELDVLCRQLVTLVKANENDSTGFVDCIGSALAQIQDLTETCKRTISNYRNSQPHGSSQPIPVDDENWQDEKFSELAAALDLAGDALTNTAKEIEGNQLISRANKVFTRVLARAEETIRTFIKIPAGLAASIEGVPVRKPKRVSLNLVPIEIGQVVHRVIEESTGGVLAIDRHLRTGDSFERFRHQWGLIAEPVEERVLGEPSLVLPGLYLPVDVTSPTARSGRRYHWEKYMERTANLLRMLAETLGGRTIAAFNAHHELRRIRELLETNPPSDCIVLAQYMDGTKSSLVREYLTNPRTLLLGGRNFLDGVDLRTAGFTVLVMVKIPFVSPEEPVHRAALQTYDDLGNDGMSNYLIPLAAETSNRWIDSLIAGPVLESADPSKPAGAVILLDPRAVKNEWGDEFINLLNASPVYRLPFIEIKKKIAELNR